MIARARTRKPVAPAPPVYFPLKKLGLCLDCDVCFEFGSGACPGCGSETLAPLARFLQPVGRLSRVLRGGHAGGDVSDKMRRQLFIVARDREKLYEYVKRAFAGNPSVQVMVDRRKTDRRASGMSRIPNRRRGDRRDSDTANQLRALGWALVLLDVAGQD